MPHSVVQIRIDADLKKQAQAALQIHGLRLNDALRLFLAETVRLGRLPFDAPDPPVQVISKKRFWAMKRAQQARDRDAVASGAIKPESMLLLRPDRIKGAKIVWPADDVPLVDDPGKPLQPSRNRSRRNAKQRRKRGR
jgi:addiction module RelB/DinJ family antitoxin